MPKLLCALALLAASTHILAQQPAPTMRQMFVQDQRDRGVPRADNGHDLLPDAEAKKLPVVSDTQMANRDAARRAHTNLLLRDGKLQTAEDFREAALIFQHGTTADDYLLAHVLAITALAKGDTGPQARDMAALTLDRYLQAAGQKQIFGTQYLDAQYSFMLQHPNDKNLTTEMKAIPDIQTQEPYNRTLLPDAIRADFCVPPQEQQNNYITATNAGKSVDLPNVLHCQ